MAWDGLGEPVDAGDDDAADAPVGPSSADLRPELRAFGLLDPGPENVLDSLGVYADGDMGGLVADRVVLLDLHHQGVHEDHRIEGIQGPGLPRVNLVQDRVGDVGDRLGDNPVPLVDAR